MVLLITDSFLKLQKVDKDEYFSPQLRVLDSEKIHDFEIMWSEDKPLSEAALDIKERILNSPSPVTIIAHGKGGNDAVESLIQYPELQDKVQKLVTMQAPLWGTPIADFLTGHPIMGLITKLVCKAMGCRPEVVEELGEMNRQVYMIINKEKIQRLIQNVQVLTVGSSFEMPMKSETRLEKVMKQIQKLISKHAGLNDGLVPLFSTRLANEPHVQLENVTHLTMVTPSIAVTPEVEVLTRNVLKATTTSGPSEYPTKFPWGQSEERNDSKPGHPYQLEIS